MLTKILPALGLLSAIAPVCAAPDLSRKSDTAIIRHQHSGYAFDTLTFSSADGERAYRVYLGIPKTPAPKQGYPVLYALDGNALTETLTPERLRALKQPPVLVLIGYDTDLRLHPAARAHDYTPPNESGQTFPDALDAARSNGGAAEFLTLINTRIKPQAAARAAINPKRQTLWGHSYGGLFVLYTLLHAPESFSHYTAADPSLWHAQGQLYRQYQTAFRQPDAFRQRSLTIEQSGLKREQNTAALTPEQAARLAARRQAAAALPPDAARTLVADMAQRRDIQARYTAYPQLDHGGLLPVSFLNTLENAAANE